MKALFLGGDVRQKYACEYLIKNNIDAEYESLDHIDDVVKMKIKGADIIALPIPFSRDEINVNLSMQNKIRIYDLISLINRESITFGGQFSKEVKDYFISHNITYIDYFDIEAFQIQNALLSAEGAIYYAKQKFQRCIYGSEIAILGFGRIGKILAYLLHLQGAKITVCARKDSDFTWSRLIGFNGVKMKISGNMSNLNLIDNKYDIIFNTIPSWIMDEEFAKRKNSNTIIIDLASHPFGIDEKLVSKYNLVYYRETGIPGRYAPESAGEIIATTILNNINNMEG